MSSPARRGNTIVVVLMAAAAVSGSTALVPGMWRLATTAAGLLLVGLGLYLAVQRARTTDGHDS